MKALTRTKILNAWEAAENVYPDKSTEFLLAKVSDIVGVDQSVVVRALHWQSKQVNK